MTQSPRPWCSAIPARSIMPSARLAPEDWVRCRGAATREAQRESCRTGSTLYALGQTGREQLSDITHPDPLGHAATYKRQCLHGSQHLRQESYI
jgi:hypothetical protein